MARLCEMVCRRLREHHLHARTVQLKLRYSDFSTITRARSLKSRHATRWRGARRVRELFRKNWKAGAPVRLLGVHLSGFEAAPEQLELLAEQPQTRMKQALGVVDSLRDRFGERAVSLASGLRAGFRERIHENPAALPGKSGKKKH